MHPALRYAIGAADGTIEAPKYVRLQCGKIRAIWEGQDPSYFVDEKKIEQLTALLSLIRMPPNSPAAGKTVAEAAAGYQWLLWTSALCVVHRDDPTARRYKKVLLEIARKNAKTFDVAVFFILLLLTEPQFSKLYSVAPDGKLSKLVQDAMRQLIKLSPALDGRFKPMRDQIRCLLTESEYFPLNYSNDRLDGTQPNAYLIDEVGALPNNYALEAMRSGQITVKNPLGCVISTRYPKLDNPFEGEIDEAKRVLEGELKNDGLFALLYEPDDPKAWMTDDRVLLHANPLAAEVPPVWEELLLIRERAIVNPATRENALCKHMNILYQGAGTESYVSIEDVRRGEVDEIDWSGKEVWLGLDLAMTNDNCAVAIVALSDDGGIYADAWAFYPKLRREQKSAEEKVDYAELEKSGKVIACGDEIVSYAAIEEFVLQLEDRLGVVVRGVGFDRYNAISTAQKLEAAGYETTEVVQHSRHLHPATKWLAEKIERGRFYHEANLMLDINFANAQCTYDTNLNRYVNKKRSRGKVDMVAALIDASYLAQLAEMDGEGWVVQM